MVKLGNEHARELAKLGAAKGGKARASSLSEEARRAIAQDAAAARWGTASTPRATHTGEMVIAGRKLAAAVLDNGKRVLTQATFLAAVGRVRRPKGGTGIMGSAGGLPAVLAADNLQPFVTEELRETAIPVMYRTETGAKASGYDAMLLPMVCEVYLRARDADAIHYTQRAVVEASDLLMRGLARVGIVALVDEATGYQEDRARDELSKILEHYIAAELRPWVRTFPQEFFQQVYRLQGWDFKPGSAKRTPYVGRLINKHIYEPLPPGVLDELRRRNPVTETGYRRHKHFQFLTPDTGSPHLDKQIAMVTMLMRVSQDKDEFEELFNKAFSKPVQQRLPLIVDVPRRQAVRDAE